jgi:signal transduction histidine kinase
LDISTACTHEHANSVFRHVDLIAGANARQGAVSDGLLLDTLLDHDLASDAEAVARGAVYLADTSLDLAMSLDEDVTVDTIRRLALPRGGTWCIVDVLESNGAVRRLPVAHPDPAKYALARQLGEPSPGRQGIAIRPGSVVNPVRPTILSAESGEALTLAYGEENLRILRQIGFGALLVVPLIARAKTHGAITFVSQEGNTTFSQDEMSLAAAVAALCAMALDNARLYREAEAQRQAADVANQSKSQFLRNMSHELRTPLNAIGGFVDLLEMGVSGPVTDNQRAALARVKANQQHLLVLVTELQNLMRVESVRMEHRSTDVSMTQALAEVAGMLSAPIADKGLILDGPHGNADAVAWADPDRVRQILVNLVMNAVKYTPPNRGIISLSCAVEGDRVLTRVSDTGSGIPSEALESIFEPFVQLPSGFADRRGGVGLGLAISRDLARAMEGDLRLESTIGTGSQFTLSLPTPPKERTPQCQ